MYWYLGDAQFKAGQYEDALASYQHYLDLNRESDPEAVNFVEQLTTSIASGTAAEIELIG